MRLDDLVPYAGNPRGNDKAVDAVAASIRGFGFRRAIICDREHDGGTPEHPVIVNGHTRVKALKKLGYDEIPDEWIVYTDGLSEDEVKALRLADKADNLAATSDVEPIGIAAGYVTDYATGELTDVVDALYERDGVSWSREKAWNLEHNDMEVSDEFADALLGRGKR